VRAIRIDSNSGKIEVIDIDGKLQAIKAAIRCQWIEAVRPSILMGADILYVD